MKRLGILLAAVVWAGQIGSSQSVAQAAEGPAALVLPASRPDHVSGQPSVTQGHPSALWDSQDIAAYRRSLNASPTMKASFDELQAWGNKRISEPLNVPAYKLEADGTWNFPAYKRGYQDASGKWFWEWNFNGVLQQRSADVSNLGMLYAITGEEKYAFYAKRLLVELAEAYGYGKGNPESHGYDHFEAFGFDGGDHGLFLAKACHGYDLIHNLPSISAEERTHIERDLIRPLADDLSKAKYMYTGHGRWGMVCLYGIFAAGVSLDDQAMVDAALYGQGGTKDKLTGGFMDCFKPACLRDGVVWGADPKLEDQMGAVAVLAAVAEVMWHRGVDLYSYQNMAMKKPFDAALVASGSNSIAKLQGLPGIDAYRYAFRRYQDPAYLALVEKLKPGFTFDISEHLPSLP